jgi:hypothetical protein
MPAIDYPPFARVAVGNRSDVLDSTDRSKCSYTLAALRNFHKPNAMRAAVLTREN